MILDAADRVGAKDMKDHALKIIVRNFTKVCNMIAVRGLNWVALILLSWLSCSTPKRRLDKTQNKTHTPIKH